MNYRRFTAFSILYLLGITICVSGLVLNGSILVHAATTTWDKGNNSFETGIWAGIVALSLAFIGYVCWFFARRKKLTKQQ